jgi:hypothetical protein
MPELDTWQQAYYGDLQSVHALLVAPLAFLAWRLVAAPDRDRAVVPEAAGFVSALTLVFAIETMIDPIATGPLLKSAPLEGSRLATLIPFVFVLLGDWRVLLLAVGVARPERPLRENALAAMGLALLVPVGAGGTWAVASWIWPELHGQVLWMLYELGFLLLCVGLGRLWTPRIAVHDAAAAAFLRSVFGYSAAYYALWWIADFLIVVVGLDLGWAIRMVPNQLYYAFWAPFVYWRFFSASAPPRSAAP